MLDSTQVYPRCSGNVLRVPAEVKGLLLLLSAKGEYQNGVVSKFHQVLEYFWRDLIILGDAQVFYNASHPYQIEWSLCGGGGRDNVLGTLVFGRKLPVAYGQAPLRKFWIRRNNSTKFGDLTASVLVNTEIFDCPYLYCHNHSESLQLNKYSQGNKDIVYRHESADNRNPNWYYVSPVFAEEPRSE